MTPQLAVVEDNQRLREAMVRGLSQPGRLGILAYTSAEEALQALLQQGTKRPTALLTDLKLGGMSGSDLIHTLHHYHIHLPTMILTAYAPMYTPELVALCNAGVWLREKPISLAALRGEIRDMLRQGQSVRHNPFSLVDYIQLAGQGMHSLTIHVQLNTKARGTVEIYRGELWTAQLEHHRGVAALRVLLQARIDAISYNALLHQPSERQITVPWEHLLLDLARIEDETAHHGIDTATFADQSLQPQPLHQNENQDQAAQYSQAQTKTAATNPAETLPISPDGAADLERSCRNLTQHFPAYQSCAVIDLTSGETLAIHTEGDSEQQKQLAQTVRDLSPQVLQLMNPATEAPDLNATNTTSPTRTSIQGPERRYDIARIRGRSAAIVLITRAPDADHADANANTHAATQAPQASAPSMEQATAAVASALPTPRQEKAAPPPNPQATPT